MAYQQSFCIVFIRDKSANSTTLKEWKLHKGMREAGEKGLEGQLRACLAQHK